MKTNSAFTVQWFQRQRLLRLLSLLPDNGMDKDLFFFCLEADIQPEARACIKQKRFIAEENGRIRLLSPLLALNAHPTKDDALYFLIGLYSTLESAIDRFRQPDSNDIKELAEGLCKQFFQIKATDDITSWEEYLLTNTEPLIKQLTLKRIGRLDHLADAIQNSYHRIHSAYVERFGDARRESLEAFHKNTGKDACSALHKSMKIIPMGDTLRENILDILVSYYDSLGRHEETIAAAKGLLELQEKREAAWDVAETCMILSNAAAETYQTNPHWLEESDYYLDKSCEYARRARQEEEMATT